MRDAETTKEPARVLDITLEYIDTQVAIHVYTHLQVYVHL
jgi:hypothetical protein